MYESEANDSVGSCDEIPAEILARFAESRQIVQKRTLIPWSEHCTECVWPSCYTSCDLYSPRADGRCRRFVDGMVRIPFAQALNSYILKITFKRWAKLWSVSSVGMRSVVEADRAEARDLRAARYISLVPWRGLRTKVSLKRYSMKKRQVRRSNVSGDSGLPEAFMVECYNPSDSAVSMTLTVRLEKEPRQFQSLLSMQPGFNRHSVPVQHIRRAVSLSEPFSIDLTPNDVADGLTLFFGAIDFVSGVALDTAPDRFSSTSSPKICKCVVFDLDNTLWDGVLVEDGPDSIRLKPGMREIISALDSRGILMSIASKNNADDAMSLLRRFQLEEYFLVPQISWSPKSQSLRRIAKSLNVGANSLLFVDDSRFEREEVRAACPDVMILDAAEYASILQRADCQLPVTSESAKRRWLYREQMVREEAQQGFEGDYLEFLRKSGMRMTIRRLTEQNFERVYELTQRTNQMNFSGNRYSREQLQRIAQAPDLDTYVLDCEDRFGRYGTVGFGVVDRDQPRMLDLMFSCRIQGKRVEHAFMSHVIAKSRTNTPRPFYVNYRRTERNAAAGKVFDDLGAQLVATINDVSDLVFSEDCVITDDGVVSIDDGERMSRDVVEQHV